MYEYRFAVDTGDVVTLPGGQLAVVTSWDITGFGHSIEVRLLPLTANPLTHLFTWLKGPVCDRDINLLTPVGSLIG